MAYFLCAPLECELHEGRDFDFLAHLGIFSTLNK